ncbi:MAG: hypothetical protein KF718_30085 [Polyangiaceae bacterium]|nr:hypothetical protein [Polyangiaceae bacterium]
MTTTPETQADDGFRRALLAVALVGVVAVVVASIVGGRTTGLSCAVGSAAAVANLWVMGRVVRGFLSGSGRLPWALLAVTKLTVLYGGVYLLVTSGWISLLPLAIGWGALPLGIVVGGTAAPTPADQKG